MAGETWIDKEGRMWCVDGTPDDFNDGILILIDDTTSGKEPDVYHNIDINKTSDYAYHSKGR